MSTWSLGSVANFVQNVVEDIPTYLSGTYLLELAQQQLNFVNQYTGLNIGSTSIDEKYQPVLWKLTAAEVLDLMSLQGADVSSIRIGDYSVSKGQGSNVSSVAANLKSSAIRELDGAIGVNIDYFKTFDS